MVPPIADDGKTLLGWNHDVIPDALTHADNKINTKSKNYAQSAFIEKYIDYPEDGTVVQRRTMIIAILVIMGDLFWCWICFGCGFMCHPDDEYQRRKRVPSRSELRQIGPASLLQAVLV